MVNISFYLLPLLKYLLVLMLVTIAIGDFRHVAATTNRYVSHMHCFVLLCPGLYVHWVPPKSHSFEGDKFYRVEVTLVCIH